MLKRTIPHYFLKYFINLFFKPELLFKVTVVFSGEKGVENDKMFRVISNNNKTISIYNSELWVNKIDLENCCCCYCEGGWFKIIFEPLFKRINFSIILKKEKIIMEKILS